MPTYINFSPNWRANQANMSDEQIRKAAEEETRRNLARLRDLSSLYLPTQVSRTPLRGRIQPCPPGHRVQRGAP